MARIIIIDDDKDFGEIMQRRLQSAGFDVTFHASPFGSLNAIRRGSFDLVVLDVSMPALDGTQLVSLIRETKGLTGTKILLCSSMDIDSLRELTGRLNVDACLSKSSSRSETIGVVRALLEREP